MGDVRSAAPTKTPVVAPHALSPQSETRTTAAGIVLGSLVAMMLCLRFLIYARKRWGFGAARARHAARTVRIPDPIPMARVAEPSATALNAPPPDALPALAAATKGDALPAYGVPVAVAVVVRDASP